MLTRIALIVITLLAIGCSSPAPVPSPIATRPPVLLSGQSNALLFAPYLSAAVPTTGAWESAQYISAWEAHGLMWPRFEPTIKPPLRAFVWWQGEGDAENWDFIEPRGYYFDRLATLVGKVRAIAAQPTLRVLVIELGPNYQHDHDRVTTNVQADAKAWAAQDPYAVFVPAADLEYDDQGIHMAPAGYRAMVERVVGRLP